jgi:hypothetical protein
MVVELARLFALHDGIVLAWATIVKAIVARGQAFIEEGFFPNA